VKVAFLTRYGKRGASSRVRAFQYADALATFGVEAVFLPLLADRYVELLYAGQRSIAEVARGYGHRVMQVRLARATGLAWIEKELLPFILAGVELRLLAGIPYVLDLDDAVFHNYDRSPSPLVRRLLADKIDRLMAGARMVIAGNSYLARRAAAAGAREVRIVPSTVDLLCYPVRARRQRTQQEPLRVAWIGSPATVHYLDAVREPLEQLAGTTPVELHVIGARVQEGRSLRCVHHEWTLDTEFDWMHRCDVGIMPLLDSAWEQGKCGFKLIQYMACELPVVASRIGANTTIVDSGVDGFLVDSPAQWIASLQRLADDPGFAAQMGRRGRAKVEATYSVQATAPLLAAALRDARAQSDRLCE